MLKIGLYRRFAAEFLGTALLLATVVGSGIRAERLAGGNAALALLANTIATGAILFALILCFSQVSGAHFNPGVTITEMLNKNFPFRDAVTYVLAQLAGAIAGVALANAMFSLPVLFASQRVRSGPDQWLSEFVATFGLITVITAAARLGSPLAVPAAVAAYISAACWFTPSTSFANPAVTLGRSLSDTFGGIRPADVPAFILAQIIGAIAAMLLTRWLLDKAVRQQQ